MGILHFLQKIYETNKADIIAFTKMSDVWVDDTYHGARNKILALDSDLKRMIKARKTEELLWWTEWEMMRCYLWRPMSMSWML